MVTKILGWLGAGLILLAYFLTSKGKLKPQGPQAQTLNFLGALGVMINAFFQKAYPAFALNLIWALIALSSLLLPTKK